MSTDESAAPGAPDSAAAQLAVARRALATEAHWLAAGMARAAAAQSQDAMPGPAAGDEQGEWLEPRTDGYSAARKGSP